MTTSSRRPGRRGVAAAVAASAMGAGWELIVEWCGWRRGGGEIEMGTAQVVLQVPTLLVCEGPEADHSELVNQGDHGVQLFFSSLHEKKEFS